MGDEERFVIIGSNSFSGAHFADYVLRENPGASVLGISRSPESKGCFLPYKKSSGGRFGFRMLDLNKDLDAIVAALREFRPHYILNFAAQGMVGQSWSAPEQWFNTNCIALMNLASRISGDDYLRRFVQISSPEVYGPCDGVTEENARFMPSTPYAASKACGDLSLYPFYLNRGLPLVYTRATNVYGPYQQLYRIIPRTVLFIKTGKKLQLQGGGRAVKSYIHIRDVCDATLKIARGGRNGDVYHISPDGKGISIYDLVLLICEKMGRSIEETAEIIGERLGQDALYVIDSTKVRTELGWRPGTGLSEGLDEVIEWVNEYFEELKVSETEYIHKP
ncbi:MAG: GDP-mannose 4,6-dehydratase [Thermodesulfovibrionales bacterium]|nr:GDP-mannose 4,6-dehydratase [Thermodesulfovibrionales bacterium]